MKRRFWRISHRHCVGSCPWVLKGDLIEKVSFLKGASRELIHELCTKLEPVVFTPGDVIVRAGEYGRHIYFIGSGSVDVLEEDGQTLIRTLSEGDFFGELALLHAQPRTATIRAVGCCDLYMLDREVFARTLVFVTPTSPHTSRGSPRNAPSRETP